MKIKQFQNMITYIISNLNVQGKTARRVDWRRLNIFIYKGWVLEFPRSNVLGLLSEDLRSCLRILEGLR